MPSRTRARYTRRSYPFAVKGLLVKRFHYSKPKASRLIGKWQRMIQSRYGKRKDAFSTAQHIDRFEHEKAVSPYKAHKTRRDACPLGRARDASRYSYGGVRMCPCPGETRAPSMITYDPEDPYFGRDRVKAKGGNTRKTKSKQTSKRIGGRPGRYWEPGAAMRRERKRLKRLKKRP